MEVIKNVFAKNPDRVNMEMAQSIADWSGTFRDLILFYLGVRVFVPGLIGLAPLKDDFKVLLSEPTVVWPLAGLLLIVVAYAYAYANIKYAKGRSAVGSILMIAPFILTLVGVFVFDPKLVVAFLAVFCLIVGFLLFIFGLVENYMRGTGMRM